MIDHGNLGISRDFDGISIGFMGFLDDVPNIQQKRSFFLVASTGGWTKPLAAVAIPPPPERLREHTYIYIYPRGRGFPEGGKGWGGVGCDNVHVTCVKGWGGVGCDNVHVSCVKG